MEKRGAGDGSVKDTKEAPINIDNDKL